MLHIRMRPLLPVMTLMLGAGCDPVSDSDKCLDCPAPEPCHSHDDCEDGAR
jgi:hypothetical protein